MGKEAIVITVHSILKHSSYDETERWDTCMDLMIEHLNIEKMGRIESFHICEVNLAIYFR